MLHVPPWQLCPQAPQLLGSLSVFAQALPHTLSPLGHWQEPPFDTLVQVSPVTEQEPQAAPPDPQEVEDWPPKASQAVALLQQPLQPEVVLQTHMPPEHAVPGLQTLPHAPQLLLSLE
jgi:hypothetical protein